MTISEKCWLLYVLQCSDGTLYTGITNDVIKRMQLHNSGKGAKYTRSRLPCRLIAKSSLYSKSICAKAEIRFKALSRQRKESFLMEGLDSFLTHALPHLLPKNLDCDENQ